MIFDMKLKTDGRYDYSAIRSARTTVWPGGKRLAVHLCLNVEHFSFGEGLGVCLDSCQPLRA
jgi:hypothetical protein